MSNNLIDVKCFDGTEVTEERIDNCRMAIDFYRKNLQGGDLADIFYESHLVMFEEGLKRLAAEIGYDWKEKNSDFEGADDNGAVGYASENVAILMNALEHSKRSNLEIDQDYME